MIKAIKDFLLKWLLTAEQWNKLNAVEQQKKESEALTDERRRRFDDQATIDIKVRVWAKEEITSANAMQKENEYRKIIHHLGPVATELKRRREMTQAIKVENGRPVTMDFRPQKPSGGLAVTGN